jgi:hypothetical protein
MRSHALGYDDAVGDDQEELRGRSISDLEKSYR